MAKIFLDQLTRMIDQATSGQIGDVTLSCKHFFSGAAVYANGQICASLTPAGFAIKLPKESRDTLLKHRGATPLRYFADGPLKKEYVVLPTALIVDPSSLRGWLEISVAYVLRSPNRLRSKGGNGKAARNRP
jgi:TfoX/Sxy family transcriptional regulator of competence genes